MWTKLIYETGRVRYVEAPCAATITVVEDSGKERTFAVASLGVYKEIKHPATIRALMGL